MARKTYLHRGLVTKLTSEQAKTAKVFDLERWLKDTFNKLFVPFNDTCDEECPVPLGQPVRVVPVGEGAFQLQRYDGTEWVQVNVSELES
jgi:hypothetical protein